MLGGMNIGETNLPVNIKTENYIKLDMDTDIELQDFKSMDYKPQVSEFDVDTKIDRVKLEDEDITDKHKDDDVVDHKV